VALPVGNKTSYRPVGQALENGKGLVRVSINLGATLSGGGGGLPPGGATGYVLTKQSAADGDADWEAVSGTGTVTSVSAGDGMDFTTITGSGAVTLGSPSTISATSLNARTATSHSHALDTSSLGFNVTVAGMAPSPNTISIGDDFDFLGDSFIQIQWNQTNQRLEFTLNSTPLDTTWNLTRADGQASTPRTYDTYIEIGNTAVVMFLDGEYTNITTNRNLNFATDYTPNPGQPVNEITVDIDTNELNTWLQTIYYTASEIDAFNFIGDAASDDIAYSRYNGGWVNSNLILDYSGGTGAQTAVVNYDERLTIVGDGTYISSTYSTYTNGLSQTIHQIKLELTPGALDTRWYLNADTDSAREIGNDAEVRIFGGDYIDTGEVTFNTGDTRWEMTIDLNLTELYTPLDLRYALLSGNATQTWVTNNFDDYGSWTFDPNTGGANEMTVGSGDKLTFVPGTDIGFDWTGDTLTINYTGTASYTGWNFKVLGVAHSIGNGGTAELIAGTGITIGYNLGGAGEHQATISLTGGSPVTSVTGGLGITSTGGTTPDIAFASSELSVGGVLVATDHLVADNGGTPNRQLISDIPLSIFNNDEGWTDNVGTVTLVGGGTGLSGTVSSSGNINLDLDSLQVGGILVGTDHLAAANDTASQKQLISDIPLSIFNNDAGWTSNAGTITGVTGGVGITTAGSPSVTVTLAVNELSERSGALIGSDRLVGATSGGTNFAETINQIPLSIFLNDEGWTSGSYSGWDPGADSGSPTTVGSAHEVNFLGSTYIDTSYNFTSGSPPTHDITISLDTTALDLRYYTQTYITTNYETYANTQTWVNNNFDDYDHWDFEYGASQFKAINSGDSFGIVGGTNIGTSWNGTDNILTINYTGSAGYTSWNFKVLGVAHSIGNGGTAELIAGSGITIGYNLGGAGEHQATISLTGGTPVTSVTGGLGITSTGGTTPDIAFASSELSVGGTLVAGDWLVADNGGTPNRQLISSIPLSIFNNDEGWTDNVGTVTLVGGGTGLSGTVSSSGNINLDLDSLPVGGTLVGTDHLAAANGTASQKQLISNIPLSIFNNDAGWTSNAGTITGVTGGVGITTAGSPSVTVTLAVNELSEKSGALVGTDRLVGTSGTTNFAETINQIPLSIFLNDEGWTAGGGSMNNWFINTDHTDSPKSIQEDAELYLIGGTGIDLTEVTFNTGDQRWELTISATSSSPWSTDTNGITYTAGNVGIGVASNSSYDLRVAGTVYFDSKLLVSGGGDNFQLYAGSTADHVYMEFFADSAAQTTRSGYFGFPSAGATQMIVRNQMSGGTLQLQSEGEVIMQPGTSRVSRIRYGSSDRIVATSAGVEISGILDIERIGQSISLKSGAASSSSYMGFYKGVLNDGTTTDPTNTTRNAYFGYASGANNDLNLYNEIANSNTMIRGGSGTGSVRLYVGSTLMQYSLAAAHYWYIAGTAELALDSNTLYPNTNLGLSLGTSSKRWNNLYVNTIYASGEVESYDTSDIRLKKILAHLDVQDAIDGLMSLRTVRYEHKHKEGIRLGLIAQDVKQPFPENIKYDPDGHLMVHYGKMVVPLVTGFQNHEQRIQALEEELEELKKQRDTWRTL
jgi:hypothetical protein